MVTIQSFRQNNGLFNENIEALTDFCEIKTYGGEGDTVFDGFYLKCETVSVGTFEAGATGANFGANIRFARKSKCKLIKWFCAYDGKSKCIAHTEETYFACTDYTEDDKTEDDKNK